MENKISISIRLNEEQNEVLKEFKQFVKDNNRGRFYGVYVESIISALAHWLETRKKEKGFSEVSALRLENDNKSILSQLDQGELLTLKEENGLPYERIKTLIEKHYIGASAPTVRDKIKNLLFINKWDIVKDTKGKEWVICKDNLAGKDFRRGVFDEQINAEIRKDIIKKIPTTPLTGEVTDAKKVDTEALDFLNSLGK